MKYVSVLFLFLACSLSCGCSQRHFYEITVLDHDTGQPIPDALVHVSTDVGSFSPNLDDSGRGPIGWNRPRLITVQRDGYLPLKVHGEAPETVYLHREPDGLR